jgi:hypothetical protein
MWARVRRLMVPVLLFLGGTGLIVYGSGFHTAPVVELKTEIETILIPPELPDPFGPLPFPPGDPRNFLPPQPTFKDVSRTVRQIRQESEPTLIREVTVGGIRLASGELMRTYTSGEAPPSRCPT